MIQKVSQKEDRGDARVFMNPVEPLVGPLLPRSWKLDPKNAERRKAEKKSHDQLQKVEKKKQGKNLLKRTVFLFSSRIE